MKNTFFLFAGLLLLASCSTRSEDKDTDERNADPLPAKACYAYLSAKDTVQLDLVITGNTVSGNLRFNFFEKDKNTGTLTGKLNGDTLIANYRFMSEGITSVTEVIFLRKGESYVQGYGEKQEVNGATVFKDRKTIRFGESFVLGKVDCNH